MKSKETFDFDRFKNEATEDLYQGKKMAGTDGVFAPNVKAPVGNDARRRAC